MENPNLNNLIWMIWGHPYFRRPLYDDLQNLVLVHVKSLCKKQSDGKSQELMEDLPISTSLGRNLSAVPIKAYPKFVHLKTVPRIVPKTLDVQEPPKNR